MAGYQILGVRSFFDEKTRKQKKYDAFFEQRWRFDNIDEIFTDPLAVLDRNKVPESERWNLFYTVNQCGDGKRQFQRMEILPFDLDGIDLDRRDEYIDPVLKVLKVKREKTAIVFSGNGLHFLVKLAEPVDEKKFFDERRGQYKAICSKINSELERLRLPGKADTAVFDAARILRIPCTTNRKPSKADPSVLIERQAETLQPNLTAQPFDFDKISGAPRLDATQAISLEELRKYKKNPGTAAMEECLFLKHVRDDAASLPEPEWYAAASIIGRFENGRELFHDVSKGHPGYSQGVTDEKFSQAVDASGPRTCANINALWGGCPSCPLYQKIKSPVVIFGKDVIPTEATGFYNIIIKENGAPSYIPCYNDLLLAYKRQHPYKTIADMKTVFVFNGTHYVDTTPLEIKGFAEITFEPKPTDTYRTEFLHKVLANELARRKFFSIGTDNKINFRNGVLDIATKQLGPHSPEFGFRSVQPYDYDPNAKCPTFDWWINDIMLGDPELVALLQEFMGYVVRGGEYKYHKALWLAGTGRNGKSTFIDILKALIGEDNYATLAIKQIIGDKFASSMLDGKIANFSEETSPEELSDSGPFKNLTGDGEVNAQKKYGDAYQFRNKAKLIMSYNEVPVLKDLSPGMLSRPIIIPFKKDLTERGAQDKTIKQRLLAELPGIFNFALEGWERLEKNGEFTHSEKSSAEMDEVRDASCSAAQWARENVEFLPSENSQHIRARDLYAAYKLEVGTYAYSETKFGRRINAMPAFASRRRRTDKGYIYVALKMGKDNPAAGDF